MCVRVWVSDSSHRRLAIQGWGCWHYVTSRQSACLPRLQSFGAISRTHTAHGLARFFPLPVTHGCSTRQQCRQPQCAQTEAGRPCRAQRPRCLTPQLHRAEVYPSASPSFRTTNDLIIVLWSPCRSSAHLFVKGSGRCHSLCDIPSLQSCIAQHPLGCSYRPHHRPVLGTATPPPPATTSPVGHTAARDPSRRSLPAAAGQHPPTHPTSVRNTPPRMIRSRVTPPSPTHYTNTFCQHHHTPHHLPAPPVVSAANAAVATPTLHHRTQLLASPLNP